MFSGWKPLRGPKNERKLFCTKFFENPSGHGRPRRKSWASAPKDEFFCGPGDGEKLFDPRASGRKGQECPREIQTKKFMFMLFFFPELRDSKAPAPGTPAKWRRELQIASLTGLCSPCHRKTRLPLSAPGPSEAPAMGMYGRPLPPSKTLAMKAKTLIHPPPPLKIPF